MSEEQIAAAVLRVVDLRPGDVLVVCPPGERLWPFEQTEALHRHFEHWLAGKDIDVVVLGMNAQFAAVRKAEAEALEQEAGQVDRALTTAEDWHQRREGGSDAAA